MMMACRRCRIITWREAGRARARGHLLRERAGACRPRTNASCSVRLHTGYHHNLNIVHTPLHPLNAFGVARAYSREPATCRIRPFRRFARKRNDEGGLEFEQYKKVVTDFESNRKRTGQIPVQSWPAAQVSPSIRIRLSSQSCLLQPRCGTCRVESWSFLVVYTSTSATTPCSTAW